MKKVDETDTGTNIDELSAKYDKLLNEETSELDKYVIKLQDIVFSYYNIIVKEYLLSNDKASRDEKYIEELKNNYNQIDQAFEADEMSIPIPEGLNEQIAEELLEQKEKHKQTVY